MGVLYSLAKTFASKTFDAGVKAADTNSKVFTSEQREKIFREQQEYIGVGPTSFNESILEDYNKSRIKDSRAFAQIKLPDNSTIGEKLKKDITTADANEVRNKIAEVFEETDALKNAQKNYKKNLKEFDKLRQKVGKSLSAQDLIGELKKIDGKVKNALAKQQEAEKQKLDQLFKDGTFKGNLKTSLNLADDEELDGVKNNMMTELEKKHAEEKKALEKEIATNEVNLHKAAEKEINEAIFIAMMYKNYPESMKRKIEDVAKEKNIGRSDKTTLEVGVNEKGINLKGITLEDLSKKGLETIKGRPITYNKDTNSFSVHFPNRWQGPDAWKLYGDPRHSIKNEIRSVVQAVKATGSRGISMKVDFKDEALAKQRARQSVEACLEGGFNPNNVSINLSYTDKDGNKVNKTYKADKDKPGENPFKDFMSDTEWQAAKAKYESNKKRDNIGPKLDKETYQKYIAGQKKSKPEEKQPSSPTPSHSP